MYWETINRYRKLKEYSWYHLAKETSIPQSTINTARLNNKCLSFENTCKIANILAFSLDELNKLKI